MPKSSKTGRKRIVDLDDWIKNKQTNPMEKRQFTADYCRDCLPDEYLDESDGELTYFELFELLFEYRKETTNSGPEDVKEKLLGELKKAFLERPRMSLTFGRQKFPRDRTKSVWITLPDSTIKKLKKLVKADDSVTNRDQLIYKLVDGFEKQAKDINELWKRERENIEHSIELARRDIESEQRVEMAKLKGDIKRLQSQNALQSSVNHHKEAALFDELDSAYTQIERYKELFAAQQIDITGLITSKKIRGDYVESRLKEVMQRLKAIEDGEISGVDELYHSAGENETADNEPADEKVLEEQVEEGHEFTKKVGSDEVAYQDLPSDESACDNGDVEPVDEPVRITKELEEKVKREREAKVDSESVENSEPGKSSEQTSQPNKMQSALKQMKTPGAW
jgi:hypothetical protein